MASRADVPGGRQEFAPASGELQDFGARLFTPVSGSFSKSELLRPWAVGTIRARETVPDTELPGWYGKDIFDTFGQWLNQVRICPPHWDHRSVS